MKRLWKATCVVAMTVAVATLASAQERGETLEELERYYGPEYLTRLYG